MGAKDYRDAVEGSVSKSDAYEVAFVTSERVGIGAKYILVEVTFDHVPTEDEFAELVRNVTSPFPALSRHGLQLGIDVPTDPEFSLEDAFGGWFPGAVFAPNLIITDVSVLREGVEGR